jgi:hypothetical protein
MSTARQGFPLRRLDAALAREVLRLRTRYQLSLDEFRGLYVSDEQVDALLARNDSLPADWADLPPPEPHHAIDAIMVRFGLDQTASDLLLFALAPDLDPAYAPLFAYLNDDVRRRWPSVDLARRLFGDTADCAAALAPNGPLFRPGLLLAHEPSDSRSPLPLLEFAANPVLSTHLLGAAVTARPGLLIEQSADDLGAAPDADSDAGPLATLAAAIAAGETPKVILTGTRSDGRVAAVQLLARQLDRPVVRVALVGDASPRALLRDGILLARLRDALLLIESDTSALAAVSPALRGTPVPIFLCAPDDAAWRPSLAGLPAVEIALPLPDGTARRQLWARALQRAGLLTEAATLAEVADRFRLSARQIDAAAASLRFGLGLRPGERATSGTASLLAAARHQAGVELAGLAQRIAPVHGWADLVLPSASLRQLHHLGGAIRHRERVFAEWGFGGGPGVTALFSGSPGTGKSMSAGVLAREAGLDLWRIDLSSVVSKYIGETEKQLDRIFALARDGNAILFFDEADALFGKRSEVKDAHDRYANIEVAFLLQRLEAFDGVVILASNLARNVDQAFSRRLHFVIEFPMPDASLRERLWRASIPPAAPLAADVDLAFLARQFDFAGGDIRVAALDAAFAAATDHVPIDMARLVQAVSRQLLKQGKVPTASDFRQYRALLATAELQQTQWVAAE